MRRRRGRASEAAPARAGRGGGGRALSRDEDALLDILERIELIRERGPRSRDDLDDAVLEAATLHWLEIVGEAANRVSGALRARHPEVPWRAIVDFRNLLAHGYEYVLLDRVWQVVVSDLPRLEEQVRSILDELRSE